MIEQQFVERVNCLGCGQVGSALWEDDRDNSGAKAKLIVLSNGFHRAEGIANNDSAKIICDFCDATVN